MKKKLIIGLGIGVPGILFIFFYLNAHLALPDNHGVIDHELFLSSKEERPLIVAFGGSEGGMVYASRETKNFRDSILNLGYHFLAVGYFGTPNTPKELDRISLDAIMDTIKSVGRHPLIDSDRVAVFGGSRGAELVLNLAARSNEIDAVIAVVPSNVSLPSRFGWGETSSWTYKQKEIPFIKASDASLKLIRNGNFYRGIKLMIENQQGLDDSEIKVEKINSPVLFISASRDKVWPSTLMSNRMMERLEYNNFQFFYDHIELDGGHAEIEGSQSHIFEFLRQHFPIK